MFVVKGAFKMMERLHIKREKIADIQDVIHDGDINKDGVLDFEEWRTKMKKYVTISTVEIKTRRNKVEI